MLSHIFKKSIFSSGVFSGNEDMVEYIIPLLEMKVFLPEDMIIRQGEVGDEMYFVSTGDCIVLVRDTKWQEKVVKKLTRGDFFGVSFAIHNIVGNRNLFQLPEDCYREEQELLRHCQAKQEGL